MKLPESRSNFPMPASRFVLVFEPKNKNQLLESQYKKKRTDIFYTIVSVHMNDLCTQKLSIFWLHVE